MNANSSSSAQTGSLASRLLLRIPIVLTAARLALAPTMVILAHFAPLPAAFAACLIFAFVSDIFDGIIARRLGVATSFLRRFDSATDSAFYLAALFAAWWLHPLLLLHEAGPLVALGMLEVLRYMIDLAKFSREASYHTWSSKLWGIALFAGFYCLLVMGIGGVPLKLAIYLGIVADLEGIVISLVLPAMRSDIPSFVHALRSRANLQAR